MIYSHRTIFLFCSVLLAAALSPHQARAQIESISADGEDVAIAFFKTAETNPDFEAWAKGSKGYKSVASVRAGEYIEKETQRLVREWREYDPETDVLNVRADVDIEIKAVTDAKGDEKYWMYIMFEGEQITYFPYSYQEYDFAIIPQKIETLTIQELQKQQFELMSEKLGKKSAGPAVIYLQLKPVRAYINQPYLIDNAEQWALLCDVATMSLTSKKGDDTFWNYGADWYVSPVTEQLQDLYKAPTEGATAPSLP